MSGHDRLLLIVESSLDTHGVADKAARLAKGRGLRTELRLYFDKLPMAGASFVDKRLVEVARDQLRAEHEETLESLAAPLRDAGLDVSAELVFGAPIYEMMLRDVLRLRPAMVVKEVLHHNRLSRRLLSDADYHLIRSCPCPLLLAHEQTWPRSPRWAAAVDPLHENDKPAELDGTLIASAQEFALAVGGSCELVHVVDLVPVLAALNATAHVPVSVDVAQMRMDICGAHRDKLLKLAAEFGVAEEDTHLLEGATVAELADYCGRNQVDVVVMGAVSRANLERLFIGNTAEKLLDRLSCDLLIVKRDDFCDHDLVDLLNREPNTLLEDRKWGLS